MAKLSKTRSFLLALTVVVGISACGSDASTAVAEAEDAIEQAADEVEEAVEEAVDEVEEAAVETAEGESADEEAVDDEVVEDDPAGVVEEAELGSEAGSIAEDGLAAPSLEEEIGLFLGFMGVTDEAAVECVLAEAEAEGIDLAVADDAMFVAAIRCDREAIEAALLPSALTDVPDGVTADEDQLTCSFNGMLDFIGALDLADSEGTFAGDAPTEMIEQIASDCDLSADQVELLFS